MSDLIKLSFYLISFLASVAGAVCGIGGGVIIKPVLDSFHLMDVGTISFLSGCTVLSMTCYSVLCACIKRETQIDMRISTYLGIGAALGGILGKLLFEAAEKYMGSPDRVGAVQAAALFAATSGTLIYTLRKERIKTTKIRNRLFCAALGLLLGSVSAFLGIGGGPINLVVLYYFFSMETKTAAQNSLYIILISQIASLGMTAVSHSIPQIDVEILMGMAFFGILGGVAGRFINKRIAGKTVNKLFMILMIVILLICIYNFQKYV